ncbi:DUF4265 domain-containing protein [Streptomyces himalayensis]|uniref:DUF4265 domain-containing protein n=1 Tax=Streptomyces himalayensis subsp. himalayensis TaxID=2756131 RepID=A0A7W0DQU0_9ACTN|nr:DUF4265 domain-containing protein [Streptomyces himalayensis]MBA2949571.1 DUF4265 domain-containing protein [Streptomyces himalayensis subsp. himalayensis]
MTFNAAPERVRPAVGDQIKIWYRFVPRDGWLPYDTEGLWATQLSEDTARVANVPFFQDGVAEGEVVRFRTDAQGLHWAVQQVEASGSCTIRVLPVPSGPLGRSAHAVFEQLAPSGVGGEVFSEEFPLVAFTVRADADLSRIKALLTRGQEHGWWHFETACVTDAWREA